MFLSSLVAFSSPLFAWFHSRLSRNSSQKAGRITNDILPHTKGGEECDFVLSGSIEIEVGNLNYTLDEGDSIRFNPEIPHKIENRSDKPASYISAITPPSF